MDKQFRFTYQKINDLFTDEIFIRTKNIIDAKEVVKSLLETYTVIVEIAVYEKSKGWKILHKIPPCNGVFV